MYRLQKGYENGFQDGSGRHAEPLDVVEYRFGCRRGILMEAMHDGEAYVLFRDTKLIEIVKWCHLAVVPEAGGPGARNRRDAFHPEAPQPLVRRKTNDELGMGTKMCEASPGDFRS